jgi:hypothetical protein
MPWLTGPEARRWMDHVNDSFDMIVICTANIFHLRHPPNAEAAVIAKSEIPVLMMSAGIQNRNDFHDVVPPSFAPFVSLLREKNVRLFTRGTRTTDFLKRQGIAAEPVGCPSVFAFPDHMRMSLERLKSIDVDTAAEILFSGYLGSVEDTVHDVNQLSGPSSRPRYAAQDEFLLFNYRVEAAATAKVYNDVSGEIIAPVAFPGRDKLNVPLRHFIHFSTEQWRTAASQTDFALARRFHGGIIAAQAGIPTVWISVDDRTEEMLEFMGLPHLKAAEWNRGTDKRAVLRQFLAAYNPVTALRTYNQRLETFRGLLAGLGLRKAA